MLEVWLTAKTHRRGRGEREVSISVALRILR